MLIKAGFEIGYDCLQPTPMLLVLSPRASRLPDLLAPQRVDFAPFVPVRTYHDSFGNFCTRIVAPPDRIVISSDFTIRDSGMPDPVVPDAAPSSGGPPGPGAGLLARQPRLRH
jgi:transglutaminase-like putative cysteine protease